MSVDSINEQITNWIVESSNGAIPIKRSIQFKSSLPPEIVSIIKDRRIERRAYKKTNSDISKTEYNKLTSKLRLKIKEFRNTSWLKFVDSMGKNPTSTIPFWRRINKFRNKKNI
jgi:hypothetical protein